MKATIKDLKTEMILSEVIYTYLLRGIGGFEQKGSYKINYPEIP